MWSKDVSSYNAKTITNEGRKMYFSDIEKEIQEGKLQTILKIFDFLFDPKEDPKNIFKIKESPSFISNCIEHCINIRPKERERLLKILCLFSLKHGAQKTVSKYVHELLIHKGIIQGSTPQNSYQNMINMFSPGTIEEAIKNDDVEAFIKFANDIDFDPQSTVLAEYYVKIYYPNEHDRIYIQGLTYMKLIALFGSVKCFKAALSMKKFSLENIEKYAVAGGSKEIIRILEQNNVVFHNCYYVSVIYHRYEISDWLIQNYICERIEQDDAILSYNIRAFYLKYKHQQRKGKILLSEDTLFKSAKIGSVVFAEFIYNKLMDSSKYRSVNAIPALHKAIENNNLPLTKFFAEKCTRNNNLINYNNDRSAFEIATSNCYLEITKYLIEKCNVSKQLLSKDAIVNGVKKGNLEFIKFIQEKFHVENDLKIPQKNPYRVNFALLFACENGNIDIIKYLVEELHADTGERNRNDSTPIIIASKFNHLDAVKYLAKECHVLVNSIDTNSKSPLFYASDNCNLEMTKFLIEECHANVDDISKTAASRAIEESNIEFIKYLHACNFVLDQKTRECSPLTTAIVKNNISIVKFLIETCHVSLTKINIINSSGEIKEYLKERCLLHDKCKEGELQAVKILIEEKNYFVDQKYNQKTPLEMACRRNNLSIIKYLVEEAHADTQNVNYRAIIRKVDARNTDLVKYLFEKKIINLDRSDYALDISYYDRSTKEIDFPLLEKTILMGNFELLKFLIEEVNVLAKPLRGLRNNPPLHMACEGGNMQIIKYLVEKVHVDVNQKGISETALSIACQKENLELVKYLIEEAHASVFNQRVRISSQPLFIACVKKNMTIIKYLVEEAHANVSFIRNIHIDGILEEKNSELMNYLLTKCKVDVNELNNSRGSSILIDAMRNKKTDIIKFLVEEHNATVTSDIVIFALIFSDNETAKYMIDKYNFKDRRKPKDKYNYSPDVKMLEVDSYLNDDFDGIKSIYYAAINAAISANKIGLIKLLVEKFHNNIKEAKMIEDRVFPKIVLTKNLELIKLFIEECHSCYGQEEIDNSYGEVNEYLTKKTLLHKTCKEGTLQEVKDLIEKEHYYPSQIFNNETPLSIASESSRLDIIKYLVEECHVDKYDISFDSLYNACKKGDFELVKYLIDKCEATFGEKPGKTKVIDDIIKTKNVDLFKYVEEKTDIFSREEEKMTAKVMPNIYRTSLYKKEENELLGVPFLYCACENECLSIVKYLAEKDNFDVEEKTTIRDKWGELIRDKTALHIASIKGNIPIMKFLIDKCKANVEVKSYNGLNALHFACKMGNLDAVKCLVEEYHMNIEEKDKVGRNALAFAKEEVHFSGSDREERQKRKEEVIKYLQNISKNK